MCPSPQVGAWQTGVHTAHADRLLLAHASQVSQARVAVIESPQTAENHLHHGLQNNHADICC
jgi:hypothetical protein